MLNCSRVTLPRAPSDAGIGLSATMRNLTPEQWSEVLRTQDDPAAVASRLQSQGAFVPWSQILVDYSADCLSTLDLGCGRGEHSAVLALAGRQTTLLDWSDQNLAFCRALYDALGKQGTFCKADMTGQLPLESNSIDMVFSCGVLEYFDAVQVRHMLREALRVARKRVIIMVPNAWSVAYRLGKWYMERTGTWEWGGEIPSYSLKSTLTDAGAVSIDEFSVGGRHSLDFLDPLPGGQGAAHLLSRVLRLSRHAGRTPLRQGYLLVAVGEKR